eukprot:3082095-Pyramimonas_sp.AAC.1
MASQANAIISAISSSQGLTLDDATKVTAEVNSGPWTESQILSIATTLSNAVSDTHLVAKGPRAQQKCESLE